MRVRQIDTTHGKARPGPLPRLTRAVLPLLLTITVVGALPALAGTRGAPPTAPGANGTIAVLSTATHGKSAGGACVGTGSGCVETIQEAVDAARDGDTIMIGRGTYAGGVTIDKSVRLTGAGGGASIVRGGGPVITIGGGSRVTVAITGLTITGGVTTTSPFGRCGADVPTCGPGYTKVTALGGGIAIAPAATVTIERSVVSGNRAAPTTTVPSVTAMCPAGPCPAAQGGGGGIDNWGNLTLIDSVVVGNVAGGGVTAQADGGGILSEDGANLTLVNSTVRGNRATVSAPNGRFASGGGVYLSSGRLVVRGSTVGRNRAEMVVAMPPSVDVNASCGGICLGEATSAVVRRSVVSGNVVAGSNSAGVGVWCGGGLSSADARSVVIDASTVSGNRVTAVVRSSPQAPGAFLACSGALDLFAESLRITDTRVVGNRVSARAASGGVLVVAGAVSPVSGDAHVVNTVLSGNIGIATSANGSAVALGGAIANGHDLEVRGSKVTGNAVRARGRSRVARGGGIFDGQIPDVDQPGRVRLVHSTVVRNTPDQCFEC
jgi:hypothetical protein